MDNIWDGYYSKQVGSGLSGFSGYKYQNGNGFWGKILKNLKPALKYITRQGLSTTSNIVRDFANGEDFSKAAKMNLLDTGKSILNDGMGKIEDMKTKQKG